RSWPDGAATFTDYLDSDGIERADVRITATVTIEGDEVTADLTDCAPMVRGSLNSTRSFIEACVYQAVRCALTVEIPNTSGAFRPIHVLTKPGTIAEVVMPGASSMRGVTGFRVLDAVNGALAQLVPARVGGAGEGGNTLAIFGADRAAHAPYGLQGGKPGALSSNVLIHPDGSEEVLPSMFSITIQPGDVYVHRTAGGGGWGDPAKRDAQRIADDVADGKVTRWTP